MLPQIVGRPDRRARRTFWSMVGAFRCGTYAADAAPEFMGIPRNQGQQYRQGTGGRFDRILSIRGRPRTAIDAYPIAAERIVRGPNATESSIELPPSAI